MGSLSRADARARAGDERGRGVGRKGATTPPAPRRLRGRARAPHAQWTLHGCCARLRREGGAEPLQCCRSLGHAERRGEDPRDHADGSPAVWARCASRGGGRERTRAAAGIPVTTPARTLIDLADVAPRRTLERAIDEAEFLRLDCTGLAPRRGRKGCGTLMRVLAEHRPGSTRTRTHLEELFIALCDRYRPPAPGGERLRRGLRVRLRLARAAADRRDGRRRGS